MDREDEKFGRGGFGGVRETRLIGNRDDETDVMWRAKKQSGEIRVWWRRMIFFWLDAERRNVSTEEIWLELGRVGKGIGGGGGNVGRAKEVV